MTDQSMIERVARAIRAEIDRYWQDDSVQPDDNALAIAVIKAMREPTEAMITAMTEVPCDEATPGGVLFNTGAEANAIWRSAIDAALKGEG